MTGKLIELAMPMGLLEEDTSGTPLTNMLQGLNRFLLEKIVQDHRSIAPHSVMFDQVGPKIASHVSALTLQASGNFSHNPHSVHELSE